MTLPVFIDRYTQRTAKEQRRQQEGSQRRHILREWIQEFEQTHDKQALLIKWRACVMQRIPINQLGKPARLPLDIATAIGLVHQKVILFPNGRLVIRNINNKNQEGEQLLPPIEQ